MNVPQNLKFTKEHEWVLIEGDTATIGITDFAQSELGELVYVEVDTIGECINEGEIFGTVEAVKTTSELFMPLTGTVLEFNDELNENEGDNPGVINEDAYGAGWIIKIKIENQEEIENLLDAEAYLELIS